MAGHTTQLTDTQIRNFPAPVRGQAQYADGKIPGFGVRVSTSGVKTFYFTYRINGRSRRLTLGRYPYVSLGEARGKAHAALTSLAKGIDPQVDPMPAARSFSAILDQFVELHCKRNNRASTAHETERMLRTVFLPLWRNRPVTDISRSDILGVTDRLVAAGTASAANHAFAAIRKFFNWCVQRDLIAMSPCHALKTPAPPGQRSHVLADSEIIQLWHAASREIGYPFGTIVQLLTLTAQRRSEVSGMRWDELDLDQSLWTIPGPRTKNGHPHTVPLTVTAIAILNDVPQQTSPFVFPARGKPEQSYTGYSKGKRMLDAAAGMHEWTLHDLRRTVATRMAQLGVLPHVVERVLNHVSGTFGGVAGIYNRFQYLHEMRAALVSWEAHLLALLKL